MTHHHWHFTALSLCLSLLRTTAPLLLSWLPTHLSYSTFLSTSPAEHSFLLCNAACFSFCFLAYTLSSTPLFPCYTIPWTMLHASSMYLMLHASCTCYYASCFRHFMCWLYAWCTLCTCYMLHAPHVTCLMLYAFRDISLCMSHASCFMHSMTLLHASCPSTPYTSKSNPYSVLPPSLCPSIS